MDMFALESELVTWEAKLPSALGIERAELLCQLAWHLRQRAPKRAMEYVQTIRKLALDFEGTVRTRIQARALLVETETTWLEARLDQASRHCSQALTAFNSINNLEGIADAHWLFAWIHLDGGNMRGFDDSLAAMRAAAVDNNDQFRIDVADVVLARWELLRDLKQAEQRWGDRFVDKKEFEHPALAALVHDYFGTAAHQASNYGEAARHLVRVYESSLATGQIRAAIIAATNTAEGLNKLNDHQDALEWVQRALELARPTNWPRSIGACLMHMADTQRCLGRVDAAHQLLHEALEKLEPIKQSRTYAIALQYLGDLALDRGNYTEALGYFFQLEARGIALNQSDFQIDSRRGQAHALSLLNRHDEALKAAQNALTLSQSVGDASREIAALKVLAEIHAHHQVSVPVQTGVAQSPLHFLERAIEVANKISGYTVPSDLWEAISRAHAANGDYARAYEFALEALAARTKTQSQEATNRAVAMEIMHQTERARTLSEYHRHLAAAESKRSDVLQQTTQTLERLGAIGLEITAHLDTHSVFDLLERHVRGLMDAVSFAVLLVDEEQQVLNLSYGVEDGIPLPVEKIALNDPLAGSAKCARERREIMLDFEPDIVDPTLLPGTVPTLSALYAPLSIGEHLIGVMTVQSRQPHAYSERDRLIFRTLSAYGAIALDNADAYQQLKNAQEQLASKEKLAALGGLVAGVAHELNTPIGNGLMIASTLAGKVAEVERLLQQQTIRKSDLTNFLSETAQASKILLRGLQNAADLVSSFKQVAVDRTTAQRREFDLQQVSREVAATMMSHIRKAGHTIDIDIPEGITLNSYPGPYGQILTNLISNSLKHAFEGRKDGHITLTARVNAPGRVAIDFNDDGVGIPPEHLKRVFEPFFTTKMGQGGSGLGLSIVYNITTALLGGEIHVESPPGQGTRFTLDLPLSAPIYDDAKSEKRGFY